MAFSTKEEKENTLHKVSKFPREFGELRFWSFVFLALIAVYLMYEYAMTSPVQGLTDPFYSPTFLVLPLVAGFRATCYAYRKDYHRHLFRHPVACGVPDFNNAKNADFPGEKVGRSYTGETGIFRLENLHRYFWYTAVLILPFFYYDLYLAMSYNGEFTLGVLLLILNTLWVTLYTFSCHSWYGEQKVGKDGFHGIKEWLPQACRDIFKVGSYNPTGAVACRYWK